MTALSPADWDKVIIGIDPGTNVMGYGILGVKAKKPAMAIMSGFFALTPSMP